MQFTFTGNGPPISSNGTSTSTESEKSHFWYCVDRSFFFPFLARAPLQSQKSLGKQIGLHPPGRLLDRRWRSPLAPPASSRRRPAASCPLAPLLLFASCTPPLLFASCLPAGCHVASVVAPPPPPPRDFALTTSSLPRMCIPFCSIPVSDWPHFLESAEFRGLLLIPRNTRRN